jgi:hypothetical protein
LYSDVSELQFFRYLSQNILSPSLTHLSHPQNLIYLCARCHRLFDAQSPVIVILPSDIRFFVDWENSDYESRCKAAEDGKEVPRTVPTPDDYPGKYRAYRIGEAFCAMEEKPWGGSPSAMILKACAGLFKPISSVGGGNSAETFLEARSLVSTLMNLYARPDPKPSDPITSTQASTETLSPITSKKDNEGKKDPKRKKRVGDQPYRSLGGQKRRSGSPDSNAPSRPHMPPSKGTKGTNPTRPTRKNPTRKNPPRQASTRQQAYKIELDSPWMLEGMSANDVLVMLGYRARDAEVPWCLVS